LDITYAPIAGALVGFTVGLTGIGGGALMAPILLTIFNIEIQTVIATDLLYATFTKLFSVGFHTAKKRINWQIACHLWLGSLPATIIVMVLLQCSMTFGTMTMDWLKSFMGLMILFSGVSWFFSKKEEKNFKKTTLERKKDTLTITSGFFIGTVTTLTSIGAGSFGAFLLKLIYPRSLPVKKLIATETVHAIPVSLIAGIGFLLMGKTDLNLLFYLLLGSLPAVLSASFFMEKISGDIVKRILGGILIIVSIKLIFNF
jgi:uncharacterized membrane protein YfcA